MKTLVLNFIIPFLFVCSSFAQDGVVVVGKKPQKVPPGKKWQLDYTTDFIVTYNTSVFNSGSMCHSEFFSNPRQLSTIIHGNYGSPKEVYSIFFKDYEKTLYGRNTILVIPTQLKMYRSGEEGYPVRKITFYEGESVYVAGCLVEIAMIESKLTDQDQKYREQFKSDIVQQKLNREIEREANLKQKQRERNTLLTKRIDDGYFFDSEDLSTVPEVKLHYDTEIDIQPFKPFTSFHQFTLAITPSGGVKDIKFDNELIETHTQQSIKNELSKLLYVDQPGKVSIDQVEFPVNANIDILVDLHTLNRYRIHGEVKKYKNDIYKISNLSIYNIDNGFLYRHKDNRYTDRPERFDDFELYHMLDSNPKFRDVDKGKMDFSIEFTDYRLQIKQPTISNSHFITATDYSVEIE